MLLFLECGRYFMGVSRGVTFALFSVTDVSVLTGTRVRSHGIGTFGITITVVSTRSTFVNVAALFTVALVTGFTGARVASVGVLTHGLYVTIVRIAGALIYIHTLGALLFHSVGAVHIYDC